MKMIPRPRVKPAEAFKLLEDNDFNDTDMDDGSIIAIEPGMDNLPENMVCFVPSKSRTRWLESYGVHTSGKRWTWVT
jgi:hypothetical protein